MIRVFGLDVRRWQVRPLKVPTMESDMSTVPSLAIIVLEATKSRLARTIAIHGQVVRLRQNWNDQLQVLRTPNVRSTIADKERHVTTTPVYWRVNVSLWH